MKTAISLPDEVFEQAEKLAKRLNLSRSELYSQALRDYLRTHAPDAVTDAYNRVAEDLKQDAEAFTRAAARKVFESAEW
jgi:metal-responsive CopG/Arc/MetJ family transcriptional regulator